MPAKNQTDPNSRNSKVLAWYQEHPGFHRCVTVAQQMTAEGFPVTTHDVATSSRVLHERGVLDRHALTVGAKRKTPVTHYGVPATYVNPSKAKTEEAQPV